jgi:ATP-dependent RNA helicase DeaD
MEKRRFVEVALSEEIQRAVIDMGFIEMTPIQNAAIEPIIEGKDIIGQAQTGTGKTLAFSIPIIERLQKKGKNVEALILCPTRELAVQVSGEMKKLAKYRKDLHIVPVYGGQPIQRQIDSLRKGARIVIGTPGRILDHLTRGTLRFEAVRMVVLDEADKMLDMGFVDDIKTILWATSEERQTLLFSATIPASIMDLMKKYQKDPRAINVIEGELTVPEVEQGYFEVRQGMKLDVLCKLIDSYSTEASLVFCNTKRKVDEVVKDLQGRGYRAEGLHGDMTQARRDNVMLKFRRRQSRVLVATDVAARGIDVHGIEAVINYDLPRDEQYYIHRIGRTARMGRSGMAFSLVLSWEIEKLREIQTNAKTTIIRQLTSSLKRPQAATGTMSQPEAKSATAG